MREFRGLGLTKIQENWINELYTTHKKRGRNYLRHKDSNGDYGFCCLGIFADSCQIAKSDSDGKFWHESESSVFANSKVLTNKLTETLGLMSPEGGFKTFNNQRVQLNVFVNSDTTLVAQSLAQLNDWLGLQRFPNFEFVADFIVDHRHYIFSQFLTR